MLSLVIFNQTFHGSLHNAPKVHAFLLKSLFEWLTVYLGYRPVETYWQLIPSVVLPDIAAQKAAEALLYKVVDAGLTDVFGQERHKAGEESVGFGLAVNAVNDFGTRQFVLLKKPVSNFLWHLIFQNIAHKQLA